MLDIQAVAVGLYMLFCATCSTLSSTCITMAAVSIRSLTSACCARMLVMMTITCGVYPGTGSLLVVVRSPVLLASMVETSTEKPRKPIFMLRGRSVTSTLTCSTLVTCISGM